MKAVLEEGTPGDIVEPLRRLGAVIDSFRPEWRGLASGKLLAAIKGQGYQILLTNDKYMGFQLNLRKLRIAIFALPISRPDILLLRLQDVFETLTLASTGQVISMDMSGRRSIRSLDENGILISGELGRLAPFWP